MMAFASSTEISPGTTVAHPAEDGNPWALPRHAATAGTATKKSAWEQTGSDNSRKVCILAKTNRRVGVVEPA